MQTMKQINEIKVIVYFISFFKIHSTHSTHVNLSCPLPFSLRTSRWQDIYVWGPPCQPYTQLNTKRRDPTYNPTDSPQARPFRLGVQHISNLAAACICANWG